MFPTRMSNIVCIIFRKRILVMLKKTGLTGALAKNRPVVIYYNTTIE